MPFQPEFHENNLPFKISPIPDATSTTPGVMSPGDKQKLDSLTPPAPVPAGSVLGNPGPGPAVPRPFDLLRYLSLQAFGQAIDYIFDPSAPFTKAPVFITLSELMAAVSAGPKNARVWFCADATISASWRLPPGTWFLSRSLATGTVSLTTSPGIVLDNLAGIGCGLLWKPQNSAPCLTWTALPASDPLVFGVFFGAFIDRSGSTSELGQIPDGRIGVYALVLAPTGLAPAPGAGSSILRGMGPSATMVGYQGICGVNGGIQPGDFSGQGTLHLQDGIDARVIDSPALFPNFSGVIAPQIYTADPRNFGPKHAGSALGVAAGAPADALPNFLPIAEILGGVPATSAPPLSAPDDWDFGVSFVATDARWAISTHIAIDPTPLRRGDSWINGFHLRKTVLNDRLLLQVSADVILYEVGTYPLQGGFRADDAVALTFTIDSSNVVIDDALFLVWSQTTAGDADLQNALILAVSQTSPDVWFLTLVANEAGSGSILYSNSFAEFDSPALCFVMDAHSGVFRGWVGNSLQSLHRLSADHPSPITPDRVGIYLACGGTPNRTYGLGAFRRRSDANF